jgi:hypothetical protein
MKGLLFLLLACLLPGCGGNGGKHDADAQGDPDVILDDGAAEGDPSPDPDLVPDPSGDPDAEADLDAPPEPDGEIATVCEGNCHFVREGAAGRSDGSDWDNAWTQLPEDLERGHVYFVADGSYPGVVLDDPESGESLVTVKKATAFDPACTETAGWSPDYGDGTALFPSVRFTTGHWDFDGVVGEGESARGFEVTSDAPAEESVDLVVIEAGVGSVALRHVDIHRPSMDYKASGVYATAGGNTDLVFSDCFIHDVFGVHFYFIDASGILIERSWMERNKSTADWHSESIQARGTVGLVVRYSWFEDIQGTAVIVSGSGNSSGWEIYGNVFNRFEVGHGAVADNMNDSISGVRVYNNTIVGGTSHSGIRFFNSAGDNVAYDNLWYGCDTVVHEGVDYDYNYYSDCGFTYAFAPGAHEPPKDSSEVHTSIDADPFVASGARDFHLAAPLDGYPGLALEPPCDTDPDGLARGADGVWDRGAFDFAE